MKKENQVNKDHYNWDYESIERWRSYYKQIDNILKNIDKENDEILEIGVGNHFVQDKLKRLGVSSTSVDFDEELNPDVVANITDLPFENDSFNLVCAFEVLEHLPFDKFEKALKEMKRVSKKTILFSVPYKAFKLHLAFKFLPYIPIKKFEINIPYFFMRHEFDGQHYWEAGKRNYSVKKIKNKIKRCGLNINYVWKPKEIQHIGFCVKK